jgi:hypothetical protein
VQKISYYTYDPKTRILLEATRLVDHYEGHCTQLQLDKIKKLFTKENEGAMPPYFGYGNFFGYTVWYVIDDHTAEGLQEQIDYAVKCKQEKIERNFATDIVNQGWFDMGSSLFIDQDSIVRLDSGSNMKTQMEITGELYRKDPMASVHLYSQAMIKILVGPVCFGYLTGEIDRIKFNRAESARIADERRIQKEKDEATRARIFELQCKQARETAEREAKEDARLKKENPGLLATKTRMAEFKASVFKDEEFVKNGCDYNEFYIKSAAHAAGLMRGLKEVFNMEVNCRTGTGFWSHGSLKTTFDQWQAISQEVNLGHLQYIIADNETRIKITDGTNYISLYIGASDIKNCHVVDAKLPDIGEHVFTIISKKSAVQIKRNASIELLNAVYHKDFEQRGVGLIKFAENAILDIQTRQEILDSGYRLKQAGKL